MGTVGGAGLQEDCSNREYFAGMFYVIRGFSFAKHQIITISLIMLLQASYGSSFPVMVSNVAR